ncbi:TolC family protein [Helicovermis profundi]|uniref:Outer membrane efflux protein n=1 Tax=Helicovermis profundi TaxID=3065157 RepID=A0AAU9EHH8_9FIRM|nr:hypothetical protein HLPR_26180 [Clostridia bacterium S502]
MNKVMNKKIVSIVLMGMLILSMMSISFADNNVTPVLISANISKNVEINFDKALEMAVKNSYSIATIDRKILIATRKLNSDISKADSTKLNSLGTDAAYLENGKIKDLYPAQDKRKLNDLKDDKKDLENALRQDVVAAYTDLDNKLNNLTTIKTNYNTSVTTYEQNKKKFDLGLITESDLKVFESTRDQNLLEVKKANLAIELSQMELARITGYDLSTKFTLSGVYKIDASVPSYDIESLSVKAKENSKNVVKAKNDLMLKELEKTTVDKYSRYEKPDSYEDLENAVEDLTQDLEDAKIAEELKLRSDYNTIMNNEATVKINELRLELATRTYKTMKLKYEYGLATYLDYTKTIDAIKVSTDTLNDSKLALFKSVDSFNNYISYFNK